MTTAMRPEGVCCANPVPVHGRRHGLCDAGLWKRPAGAVPLVGTSIHATVTDWTVRVAITQQFANDEDGDIEVTYRFPVAAGSVVADFEADVGGRVLRGRSREKEVAKDAYDDAVAAGKRTALLERVSGGVFEVFLGRMPGRSKAAITITCVGELADQPDDPDAMRLVVPLSVFARESACATDVRVTVQAALDLAAIESPSHAVRAVPRPGAAQRPVVDVLVGPKESRVLPQGLVGSALDEDFQLVRG